MRFLPDTIASRTIAVLLVGVVVFHVMSVCAYQIGLDNEITHTNERRLAERLLSIQQTLAGLSPAQREPTAHALSGGPLEVHWSAVPLTVDGGHGPEMAAGLHQRLLALAPELASGGLIIGLPSPSSGKTADSHLLFLSMRLADRSWANFSLTRHSGNHGSFTDVLLSTSLMAAGVLLLSSLVLRSVTRPLRQCAVAAQRLFMDADPQLIAVIGPRETRDLASAFNELQHRVKRLVDDRTLLLAAISHDLKTPLARAQLRVEEIESAELRRHIDADLAEMLVMIESTLEFLKSGQTTEPLQDVELRTILETVCDDMADLGHQVTLAAEDALVLRGRHLALKRAFTNLVANAAKYGRHVFVAAACCDGSIVVTVDDDGPGIPSDQREAVFQPFYRIEASRNRATGGTGLGLTVARTIVRGHGGDITLGEAPAGGLRARVNLPRSQGMISAGKQKDTRLKSG